MVLRGERLPVDLEQRHDNETEPSHAVLTGTPSKEQTARNMNSAVPKKQRQLLHFEVCTCGYIHRCVTLLIRHNTRKPPSHPTFVKRPQQTETTWVDSDLRHRQRTALGSQAGRAGRRVLVVVQDHRGSLSGCHARHLQRPRRGTPGVRLPAGHLRRHETRRQQQWAKATKLM